MTIVNTVQACDWRELARRVRDEVGQIDALIVDAPYSARTHSGHDSLESYDDSGAPRKSQYRQALGLQPLRRALGYEPWDFGDVDAFVQTWAPLTGGWIVSLTDSVLATAWEASMLSVGRYVFAPIACVESGSRVRMAGDGPAQWSTFAVASRPRDGAWLEARHAARKARKARGEAADCSLPGAYVGTTERGREVMGGKPTWLMEALVRDYSEPGDLIADPCCGGGTTLLAAKLLGRRYVGSDIDAEHVEIARERLRAHPTKPKAGTLALPWETE